MSLEPYIRHGQLYLEDRTLSLKLGLHQGLQLLASLDQEMDPEGQLTLQTLSGFYRNLLDSVMLLPTRTRQALIQETPLETLAGLLRLFRDTPTEAILRNNLSQRRLGQIMEEPLYLARQTPTANTLCQALAPFYRKLEEGRIKLQDPQGIYY